MNDKKPISTEASALAQYPAKITFFGLNVSKYTLYHTISGAQIGDDYKTTYSYVLT